MMDRLKVVRVPGIGIDSGGTSSRAFGSDGESTASVGSIDTSMSSARGPHETVQTLSWIRGLCDAHLSRDSCVVIGASAYSPATKDVLVDQLRSGATAKDPAFVLTNDVAALLLAGEREGVHVAVVAGTGSMVVGLSTRSGAVRRVGGYEWVVSDVGSGTWITLQLVKRLLRSLDFDSGPADGDTVRAFQDHFLSGMVEVPDADTSVGQQATMELIARGLGGGLYSKRMIASFAFPAIFAASRRGVSGATQTIREAADAISEDVKDALLSLTDGTGSGGPSPRITLSGSIAQTDQFLAEFQLRLEDFSPSARLEIVADPAEELAKVAARLAKGQRDDRVDILEHHSWLVVV